MTGLEADQKVITAHGCYAMTATTALTAQNTQGVSGIHYVPSDFVVKQIDACLEDIGVDVIKIGMLASASTVDAVAEALKKHGEPTTVVDPVMVATSGAQLLPNEAVQNLRMNLLPLTTILTPNIPEARLLLQNAGSEIPEINSLDDIVNIARVIQSLGPRYVLIKGGHLPLTKDGHLSKEEAERHSIVDVLYDGREATIYKTGYLSSNNTHGTGCSLACRFGWSNNKSRPGSVAEDELIAAIAAIASGIALSKSPDRTNDMPDAVEMAVRYVEAGIQTSFDLGHGNGPINHFHSLSMRLPPPFPSSLRRSVYGKVQDGLRTTKGS
ncbi:MAG: hypothetical protein ALECFALPRED_005278 [Alectoria fallacina]|uniref:Pyridoxamine kinase/Phosphomethylpyrimidine kinase domain-containing protein n=1 Tax=Alectoria fallacina TaxID=1903189 RepID=A0A8H3IXF7_9LECA|nr:MAG: hypothetical protein ALECFALPRED_005278 [Alectoria fallacina]